jgi:hypothetical protein
LTESSVQGIMVMKEEKMDPLTGILTTLAAKLANQALERVIDELPAKDFSTFYDYTIVSG